MINLLPTTSYFNPFGNANFPPYIRPSKYKPLKNDLVSEFYVISFIFKFVSTYHLYGKSSTSCENSNCWSMIGKSVVKLEMAYHFFTIIFFSSQI